MKLQYYSVFQRAKMLPENKVFERREKLNYENDIKN
jgi:hypothetical protein